MLNPVSRRDLERLARMDGNVDAVADFLFFGGGSAIGDSFEQNDFAMVRRGNDETLRLYNRVAPVAGGPGKSGNEGPEPTPGASTIIFNSTLSCDAPEFVPKSGLGAVLKMRKSTTATVATTDSRTLEGSHLGSTLPGRAAAGRQFGAIGLPPHQPRGGGQSFRQASWAPQDQPAAGFFSRFPHYQDINKGDALGYPIAARKKDSLCYRHAGRELSNGFEDDGESSYITEAMPRPESSYSNFRESFEPLPKAATANRSCSYCKRMGKDRIMCESHCLRNSLTKNILCPEFSLCSECLDPGDDTAHPSNECPKKQTREVSGFRPFLVS